MTEAEARTKWCPFARVTGSNMHDPASNRERYGGLTTNSYCLGSACMAWRWKETRVAVRAPETFKSEHDMTPEPEGHVWEFISQDDSSVTYQMMKIEDKLHGYCGLAGGMT